MGALRRGILMALVTVSLATTAASAGSTLDTVTGESYTGQLSDTRILIDSAWAGPLPISTAYVAKVFTQPGKLELTGGDILTGTIRNERFTFQADFAEITVEPAKVKALALEPAARPDNPTDVTVVMDNGDVVRGTLALDDGNRSAISLATAYGGVVNVSLKAITAIKKLDPKNYEVDLRDGSKVSGAILNNSYVLITPYAELVIPRNAVVSFTFPS